MANAYFFRKFLKFVNITLLFTLFLTLIISCSKKNDDFGSIEPPDDNGGSNTSPGDDNTDSGGGNNDEGKNEHTHELILLVGKAATCTEEGLLECYKCSICEKLYLDASAEIHIQSQSVLPILRHTLTLHTATLTDCTSGGYDAYYSCDICGGLFLDGDGKTQISEPPYSDALPHSLTTVPAKSPTCTAQGYQEYLRCKNCDKMFSDSAATTEILTPVMIEKAPHRLLKNDEIAPTCRENGCGEYYSCIDCGAYFEDANAKKSLTELPILDTLPHELTEYPASQPTCTQDGYSNYYVCSGCEQLFSDAVATTPVTSPSVLPALPHTPKLVSSVPSTCTEQGTESYYRCEDCNRIFADEECKIQKQEVSPLPFKPHELKYQALIESTCTEKGTIEHYKCIICQQLFANSTATEKITDTPELPLKPHIFENEKCINCGHAIDLMSYYDYIVAGIGDTVSVYGFVTAVNYSTSALYLQYEDYAYRLINAEVENIKIGDTLIAVGIKAYDTTIDCSYISLRAPDDSVPAPTPYNATELLLNNMGGVLPFKQYTYVEIDNITILHSIENEYIMAYIDADDISQSEKERFIYFTLDGDTPISTAQAALIKANFEPMCNVTVRGLICQDGNRLCLIPTSEDFLTNVAKPVEVPPLSMLKYESLVHQFNYSSLSEDCVIELNCTPAEYGEVRIKWVSESESVAIRGDYTDGYCTAEIKISGTERVSLTVEFSIDYGAYEVLRYWKVYYIDLIALA